jgi:hypothetical protein
LTSYYCFLNAVKALLLVKGGKLSRYHGVSGEYDPTSKRVLANETVSIKGGGMLPALSRYLGEGEKRNEHALTEILSNLPFIHRAYRYTYRSQPEMFIPLRNVVYRKHPTNSEVWLSADVEGRSADRRILRNIPSTFEIDVGYADKRVVRVKKRIRWFAQRDSADVKKAALERLATYHKKARQNIVHISAAPDLWYLKRHLAGGRVIDRYGMTLIMAAMHRLSELCRYDPIGLIAYLNGRESWLLTEFIELAPAQFIDELICEMTSLEFGLPMIRPRSS